MPQAYSPLESNGSPLIKDEDVQKVAAEKGLSGAEVLLGWLGAFPLTFCFGRLSSLLHSLTERVVCGTYSCEDIVVVTRSLNEGRIRRNIKGSVKASKLLTKEDIALLDGLAAGGKQKRNHASLGCVFISVNLSIALVV